MDEAALRKTNVRKQFSFFEYFREHLRVYAHRSILDQFSECPCAVPCPVTSPSNPCPVARVVTFNK